MGERDRPKRSHADFLKHNLKLHAARDKANRERDEALARVADLERALGQFSAGEAATDDTGTDLCDCPVSVVNEHLTGYCGTARLEASKAGTLMSTDCTCPPGWKHRAADCPFNPNPEQRGDDPCIHGPGVLHCGHPDCRGARAIWGDAYD